MPAPESPNKIGGLRVAQAQRNIANTETSFGQQAFCILFAQRFSKRLKTCSFDLETPNQRASSDIVLSCHTFEARE